MMNHAAQLAIIKQLCRQESHGSAGNCQANEQAGIMQLSWQLSSKCAGRNNAAHPAIVKELSRQESLSSAGPDYVTARTVHVVDHTLITLLIMN